MDYLVTERRTVDTQCADALSSSRVLGRMAWITPASLTALNTGDRLALMATLGVADLRILLAQDPTIGQKFWDNPPLAGDVAAWWKQLSAAEKDTLVTNTPAVIGNLGGIDYATRIIANNNQLEAFRHRGDLTASQKDAIAKIDSVVRNYSDRGLVDFNVSADPPLAAFAFGNLDTAQKVTWAVPGIGSKVGPDETLPLLLSTSSQLKTGPIRVRPMRWWRGWGTEHRP